MSPMPAIVLVTVWRFAPYFMVVFVAALLQRVPRQVVADLVECPARDRGAPLGVLLVELRQDRVPQGRIGAPFELLCQGGRRRGPG